MMRTLTILFCLVSAAFQVTANVNYIDITKITNDPKLGTTFHFIRDNTQYYDHWTNTWDHDQSKDELIKKLQGYYKDFSSLPAKNQETWLLLGDIAHYLYNMDDTAYYSIAVSHYNKAVKSNPNDYRAYWFLGYHYALSNGPTQALDNLSKAQNLLPANQPADFWNDYAWVYAVINMPSHCIYAMDQVKRISGKEGSFQQQLGASIYKRLVAVDKNKTYDKYDIWSVGDGKMIPFTSRPLGMKVLVDSTWGLSIYDYQKRQSVFVLEPAAIKSKKGKEISYTIAIMIKTADDNEKLDDHIGKYVSKYADKNKITFSDKYEQMIAYEIKDKTQYADNGGAHAYMIGIERDEPEYPGMLLESPQALPKSTSGEPNFYSASPGMERFKEKIFYVIILDSCEDIHEETLAVFKTMFEKYIIIE